MLGFLKVAFAFATLGAALLASFIFMLAGVGTVAAFVIAAALYGTVRRIRWGGGYDRYYFALFGVSFSISVGLTLLATTGLLLGTTRIMDGYSIPTLTSLLLILLPLGVYVAGLRYLAPAPVLNSPSSSAA